MNEGEKPKLAARFVLVADAAMDAMEADIGIPKSFGVASPQIDICGWKLPKLAWAAFKKQLERPGTGGNAKSWARNAIFSSFVKAATAAAVVLPACSGAT